MLKVSKKALLFTLLFLSLSGCQKGNDYLSSSNNVSSSIPNTSTKENNSTQDIFNTQVVNKPSSDVKEDYYLFTKSYKLYINPSVQYQNAYTNDLGNEGTHMNEISLILTDLLKLHTNLIVYANNSLPGLSLSQSVKQSNELNVDYHLALHSNAGGGKGCEGWYAKNSYDFTNHIVSSLNNLLPYQSRGLKNGGNSLYELKNSKAQASLIEILFHDEPSQAIYLTTNQEKIAYAIYDGIVSYFTSICI